MRYGGHFATQEFKRSTLAAVESVFRVWLDPRLRDRVLDAITTEDVEVLMRLRPPLRVIGSKLDPQLLCRQAFAAVQVRDEQEALAGPRSSDRAQGSRANPPYCVFCEVGLRSDASWRSHAVVALMGGTLSTNSRCHSSSISRAQIRIEQSSRPSACRSSISRTAAVRK